MESAQHDEYKTNLVYTDILTLFTLAKELEWREIRENSIYRILYLSSVLYSFRYPEVVNPFSLYKFNIHNTGPYDVQISNALSFLIKDDYLYRVSGEDILALGSNNAQEVFKTDIAQDRVLWLKQIIYILGIYGENKIYEFIFRDPQYRSTIKSNTSQGIDTTSENETVKTLQEFQTAFEETLQEDQKSISAQQYLELYFEYIFSKILKRDGIDDAV